MTKLFDKMQWPYRVLVLKPMEQKYHEILLKTIKIISDNSNNNIDDEKKPFARNGRI